MYRAVVSQILNSLMNPFHIEERIKASNSNVIQHKTNKNYTIMKSKTNKNIHDFSACKNKFFSH